ncbi:MAG: hypothetical protein COA42_22600 [Alteromonadaceae bacterium]|nr:MAG: hypothetical protein COA42_22600 [Alteromonadaceae bacterium]
MNNVSALSDRELEVLHWVALGKTNWEVSVILDISIYTVKNHVKAILRKLCVNNRTQAAKQALMQGMLSQVA